MQEKIYFKWGNRKFANAIKEYKQKTRHVSNCLQHIPPFAAGYNFLKTLQWTHQHKDDAKEW